MADVTLQKLVAEVGEIVSQVVHDPVYLSLFIACLSTVVITILLLLGSESGKRHNVLLIGSSDSGKTTMFMKLTEKQNVMTHTSIKENKGKYCVTDDRDGKSLTLIDIPGHDRIRNKFITNHKKNARAIIFVMDSSNFTKQIRDSAELMYDILADKTIALSKVPILVACNKQDLPTAKSSKVIQSQLEKEINTLRTTRAAALRATDDSGSTRNSYIGKKNKEFKFGDVSPIQVSFVESNVQGDGDELHHLSDVECWLHAL